MGRLSNRLKKYSKRQKILQIRNIFLVLLGCLILAFGDATFIVPTELLTGGIASIAVFVQYIVGPDIPVADIVNAVLTIGLFLVGLVVLGWKFSAHTLLASLAFPAFFAVFYRTGIVAPIYESLTTNFAEPYLGYFLCSILGGICIGGGVAITFLGEGSTGGLDIISIILAKYTPIKEGLSTFALDALIVLSGIIIMRDKADIIPIGVMGVLSASICALTIQVVYVSSKSFFVVEVISPNYKKFVQFIEDDLARGCTIYYGEGGFQGDKKMIVKAALTKSQTEDLKQFAAHIDPKAFLIIYPSAQVNGEGFVAFQTGRSSLLKQFFRPERDLRKWDTNLDEK